MKRTMTRLAAVAAAVLVTVWAGMADYPPSPSVKGTTITRSPDAGTAFTGANVALWIVAALVAVVVGAALLYLSRRPAAS